MKYAVLQEGVRDYPIVCDTLAEAETAAKEYASASPDTVYITEIIGEVKQIVDYVIHYKPR